MARHLGTALGPSAMSLVREFRGPIFGLMGKLSLQAVNSLLIDTVDVWNGLQNRAHTTVGRDKIPIFDDEHMNAVKDALRKKHRLTEDSAAMLLSSHFGMTIRPGDVIDLDKDQLLSALQGRGRRVNHGVVDPIPGKWNAPTSLDEAVFVHAESVSRRYFEDKVFQRGIVEFSNVCQNDYGYCGIRKYQPGISRYSMSKEEIMRVAQQAFGFNMGTLMLQSGELQTPQRFQFIKDVVTDIRRATIETDLKKRNSSQDPKCVPVTTTNLGLCVALSAGELTLKQLQELKAAGASRYLVRIETSNPGLFSSIHPPNQTFESRVQCLRDIKAAGLQLGTGIMIGIPGQTMSDLANDLEFFKDIDADMIGMGPYIPEPGTWVQEEFNKQNPDIDLKAHLTDMLQLTTRMNSLARITLGNVNIAATTALQAIDPLGREIALTRGANVVMPIMTPTEERANYQLYPGKPCVHHAAEGCASCLKLRIASVGKQLQTDGSWSDPPHFSSQKHAGMGSMQGGGLVTDLAVAGSTFMRADHLPSKVAAVGQSRKVHTSHTCRSAQESGRAVNPTAKGSDVPRVNVGVFGRMNAGKSTLVNAITRQETSIVDSTPGTTADTKIALMELHEVGPLKMFDTAGIDEAGILGSKKVKKALSALKESDVAMVVLDTSGISSSDNLANQLEPEIRLLSQARKYGSAPFVVLNHKGFGLESTMEKAILSTLMEAIRGPGEPGSTDDLLLSHLQVDLASEKGREQITEALQSGIAKARIAATVPSLPSDYLRDDAMVFLNIPMDAETPSMRLLRPQALVQEEAIRNFATTIAYRMDLAKARSHDTEKVEQERRRFNRALQPVLDHPGPKIIVTDSQAVDILHPWTLNPVTGEPLVPFTTFSIAMINRMSGGRLKTFMDGVSALSKLQEGDRVLIAEACNHNRITVDCNDIGMVQIPQALQKLTGGKGPIIEHAFGREYPEIEGDGPEGLSRFKLAIHCGACMIDPQKMRARILDMAEAEVPVVNYGLFLAYVHSQHALERAVQPWGQDISAPDHSGTTL